MIVHWSGGGLLGVVQNHAPRRGKLGGGGTLQGEVVQNHSLPRGKLGGGEVCGPSSASCTIIRSAATRRRVPRLGGGGLRRSGNAPTASLWYALFLLDSEVREAESPPTWSWGHERRGAVRRRP